MQQQIPWQKIKSLEEEIKTLKNLGKRKKVNKDPLRGILKGITFTEAEIDEAQKKIFDFKEIK